MYLYQENKNKIDIYKFDPIDDMIKEYRILEMAKIPKDERVFRAITNSNALPLDIQNLSGGQTISFEEIDYKTKKVLYGGFFHSIEKYPNVNYYGCYRILEQYYNTGYLYGRLIRVINNNVTRYYLLTQDHYEFYYRIKNGKKMESIINVPENLRILYYLENGLCEPLQDLDFEEQASLFTLSKEPIFSISRENLSLLQNSKFIKDVASETEIENNTKLVRRLQKIYK